MLVPSGEYIKTYREQANRQNFHVWNSRRQHAARLFQTTPYDRLFLSNSWATRWTISSVFSHSSVHESTQNSLYAYLLSLSVRRIVTWEMSWNPSGVACHCTKIWRRCQRAEKPESVFWRKRA